MFDAEDGGGNGGLTDAHHVALTIQNHPIGGALTANAGVDLSNIGGGGGGGGGGSSKSGARGGGGGLVRQGSSDGSGSGRLRFKFGGWGGGGGDDNLENEKIPPLPEELHATKVAYLSVTSSTRSLPVTANCSTHVTHVTHLLLDPRRRSC